MRLPVSALAGTGLNLVSMALTVSGLISPLWATALFAGGIGCWGYAVWQDRARLSASDFAGL